MPFFRAKPHPVEAYRMPPVGVGLSDGLVFFLEANGVSVDQTGAKPGDWIVADRLGVVYSCSPEEFDLLFERV